MDARGGNERVRLQLLAGGTGLSMVLFTISMLMAVDTGSEIDNATEAARQSLAAVDAERTRFYVGTVLGGVSLAFLGLSGLTVMALVPRRGATLATIGGVLLLIGGITFAATMIMYGTIETIMTRDDVPRDAAVAVERVAGDSPQVTAMWLSGVVTLMLGTLVSALALLRARTVPVWIPALMIVGIVSVFFGDDGWRGAVVGLPWLAAWLGLGWSLLRSLDAPEPAITLPEQPSSATSAETQSPKSAPAG